MPQGSPRPIDRVSIANRIERFYANRASRYHLVTQVIRAAAPRNPRVAIRASGRVLYYEYLLRNFGREIRETGQDPEVIRDWKWTR